jgi:RHS repeat-associated protein
VTYNEFDAWGSAYTDQPDDANYSGLDVLTGFTGYTYDAVLEVYFAQARLYDAENKRFMQTDPVGGSITVTLSFNAYLYCRDDPVNNIDPTGQIMPGDERLSTQKQAEIAVYTKQWDAANAKGDTAGMASAHAAAEAVRNRTDSSPTSGGNSGSESSSSNSGSGAAYSAAYQQWQSITAGLPPTPYTVLVEEIAKFAPALSLDEVLTTANDWVRHIEAIAPSTNQVVLPATRNIYYDTSVSIEQLSAKSFFEGIKKDFFDVMGKLQAFGCNFTMDEKGIYHAQVNTWQSIFGYNRLYDTAFNLGTSMEADTLTFSTDSETYRIWMWKGDYWGLGAGAEIGIYTKGALGTWKAGTNDTLDMTLNLYMSDNNNDKLYDNENIFRYAPDEPQWWITGFNPDVIGAKAEDLLVTAYIDFSDRPDLWDAVMEEHVENRKFKNILTFDSKTMVLGIRW